MTAAARPTAAADPPVSVVSVNMQMGRGEPDATAAHFCFRRIVAGVVAGVVTVNGAICSRRLILALERDYVQMI